MSDNPYQAPAVAEVMATSDVEEIRMKHLKHEASVKAVGFLYFLGGVLVCLSLVGVVVALFSASREVPGFAGMGGRELLIVGLLVAVGIGQLIAGWGLRKLRPWAKIAGAVVAVVGLLGWPLGTVISLYVLYVLFCEKGRAVLSPAYQDVIAQTPHLKYRTPLWIWILLILVILLFLGLAIFGTKVS